MQLTTLLSTLAVVAAWMFTASADAEFEQVRRRVAVDHSNRKTDPPGKYFHESTFHPHYDGRFAEKVLAYEDQQEALKGLVRTYLITISDLGIDTWLMHGSLLGWWWGREILPWDSDVDVQVSEASMHYLAAYHNMSTFYYKSGLYGKGARYQGENYLLEVNPNYLNREQTDTLNVIDARWIDVDSGMFIDITTVRYNLTHPAGKGILSCKDGHEFRDTYLYPLLSTTFEGSRVKIPYKYKDMLEAEYGAQAMSNRLFHSHVFDDERMQWAPRHVGGGDSPLELR